MPQCPSSVCSHPPTWTSAQYGWPGPLLGYTAFAAGRIGGLYQRPEFWPWLRAMRAQMPAGLPFRPVVAPASEDPDMSLSAHPSSAVADGEFQAACLWVYDDDGTTPAHGHAYNTRMSARQRWSGRYANLAEDRSLPHILQQILVLRDPTLTDADCTDADGTPKTVADIVQSRDVSAHPQLPAA